MKTFLMLGMVLATTLATVGAGQPLVCNAGDNCTAVLQSAIDKAGVVSSGKVILASGVWSVLPIVLRSHLLLELSRGTTIIAQRGAFHGGGDTLLSAGCGANPSVTNLTIRGAAGGGSRLEMQKHDYMNNKLYVHSEARHAICVSEALHVRISDLEIVNTGGDGIYLAGGCYSEGLSMCPSTDVELLRVTTLGAYRNGLSIVNGRDVVVRDSHFLNTSGTPPEAGIDLEPNTAGDWMFNISFVDTHSRWNRGAGLSLALEKLQCEKARCKLKPYCMCPIVPSLVTVSVAGGEIEGLGSLTLTELAALDYNIGVLVSTGTHADGSQGWLNFSNLAISNTAQPGLEFENKAADSMPVTFTNCSWDDVATAPSVRWGGTNSPILLHQSASGTIGGIQLAECRVRDMKPRPWLKCDSCNDRGSALQLSGTVAVNNTHGCTTKLGTNARNISLRVQCEADAVKAPPRGLWAKYG